METIGLTELFDTTKFKDKIKIHRTKTSRLLGIDYGTKKLGLSTSDCGFQIAFPYKTLIGDWNNVENLVSVLCKIIEDNNIIGIVIGFPLKSDGTQHDNCKTILALVKQLNSVYQEKKPILLVDERFSTRYVNQTINNSKKNTKKVKFKSSYDDDKSATVLLNGVLSVMNG